MRIYLPCRVIHRGARWLARRERLFLLLLAAFAVALSTPSFGDGFESAASAVYQSEREAASKRGDLVTQGADYERIQLITKKLISVAPEMRADAASWDWDVSYIRSPDENARCLPGGKIVVFTGLVERLGLTDDELAAVIGHEMGHALLEHGREAYTQHQVAKVAVGVLGIIAAIAGAKHHTDPNLAFNAGTAVGSLGATFLVLRPYSRERELAADKFGAELEARAGFDPRAAISLQQKLSTQGTVEFVSTHPISETRVAQLAEVVPVLTQRFAERRESQTTIANAGSSNTMPASIATAAPVVSPPTSLRGDPERRAAAGMNARSGANALVQPGAAMTPSADDPDAITGAAAAAMTSKYMFNAERYAKGHGCEPPSATMIARAPSYESFDITCGGGSHLLVRCEYGNCAAPAQ